MKKIITAFLTLALLAGCSSSTAKTTASKNTKAKETASTKENSKEKDDGVLDYSGDDFSLKLDSSELAQDSSGQNLLVNKFTFTNKTKENKCMFFLGSITYFQNGVEVKKGAYSFVGDNPYSNQPSLTSDVMPGAAAQIQDITVLTDTTDPVTIVLEDHSGKQVDSETVNLQ